MCLKCSPVGNTASYVDLILWVRMARAGQKCLIAEGQVGGKEREEAGNSCKSTTPCRKKSLEKYTRMPLIKIKQPL
jgi:hypothetical protein